MTRLPPSPFLNSSESFPFSGEAVAHVPAPVSAAASSIFEAYDLEGALCIAKAYGGEWCIGRCLDPKDCSAKPLPATEGGAQTPPAAEPKHTDAGELDCIGEIFYHARKLIAEDQREWVGERHRHSRMPRTALRSPITTCPSASPEWPRGFDPVAFFEAIEPPPAFIAAPRPEYLKACELMPMLAVLAGH